ncbi:MAG TPA: RecX family transcriptional regulator [Chlamydiales bacterium]|nr:RecX family transcriptional regulator [Chlamydiales bacterium]
MDPKSARKIAFRLLSMRSYHSTKLLKKLEEKGFPKEVCEEVIAECKRLGFLQDDEWERSAILREFRKGYGPRYIEMKLRLSREKVRGLISREMQRERIGQLVRRLGSREKAMRAVQRRGFDFDIAIEFFA